MTTYPASPEGLIFTAPEGSPIRRNTFRSRFWLPAVTDSVGPPMRFHDLRHSHVALLTRQGTHPAVIDGGYLCAEHAIEAMIEVDLRAEEPTITVSTG